MSARPRSRWFGFISAHEEIASHRKDELRDACAMQFDFLRRLFGKRERPRGRGAQPPATAVKVVAEPHDPLRAEALALLENARALLRAAGAEALAVRVRVEWDSRLRTTAGLAFPGR